jgi:hypothetical protein
MGSSLNILLGALWLFSGAIWLKKAMADEAHPSTPQSLFAETEIQTDKDRRWKFRLAILYLMLGGLYLLVGIVAHTR